MQTDSRIAILGYGVEGKAMTSYLFLHGFRNITVCDRNEKVLNDLPQGVLFRGGHEYLNRLDEFDVVFRSPGISVLRPELARLRGSAGGSGGDGIGCGANCADNGGSGASGIGCGNVNLASGKLTSLTRYFFERCPCPIIGVTGTKGKGTTATLIYKILRAAGRDVYLGGNIGEPPVLFLDRLRGDSLVVLELSSFQLMDLDMSPHVAAILNIMSEHMDYHGSFEEYVLAKQNIARYQKAEDFLILNRAHPYSGEYFSGEEFREEFPAKFDTQKAGYSFRAQQIFVDTKCHNSQDEVFIDENGMIVFWNGDETNDALHDVTGAKLATGKLEKICHVSGIGLLGEHNLENVLPAVAVTRGVYHVPVSVIAEVVKSFRGLPHRLEFAGEIRIAGGCRDDGRVSVSSCGAGEDNGLSGGRGNGQSGGLDNGRDDGWSGGRDRNRGDGQKNGVVRFYNDSFSTTPETSIAGVRAFTYLVEPKISERRDFPFLYLLAGGSEKNSAFDEWAATVMSLPNVRWVFLMGPSGKRMGAKLREMSGDLSKGLLSGLSKKLLRDSSSGSLSGLSKRGDFAGFLEVVNLREAFEKALSCARDDIQHGASEVIILLSPGAASFNEFENYKKRGEAFRELARNAMQICKCGL